MKRIDGGRGGGQLLRWAVAMAAITQEHITVENIRGARDTPGLRPQHVAAVDAAARITDAHVDGLSVGSETVTFDPGMIAGGEERVDVGTAGSISLVFDTILPLGMVTESPITLEATGGTDVKWSPPIDFHRYVKLPLLQRYGIHATLSVERRGFYPKGGGTATLTIKPGQPKRIECIDRGALEALSVHSIATQTLSDASVAERQANQAAELIERTAQNAVDTQIEYVDARSPGAVVLIVAEYERTLAGFSALGERGKPAEEVAADVFGAFLEFHQTDAAIDGHLADQLLPFIAVERGRITTPELTPHIETAVDLLAEFGYQIDITEGGNVYTISSE